MPNDHTATTSAGATGFSYNVLDLFSGIGGFSLGLERAGMRTAAFCEIDPYCRQVLERHWPGMPIHDDIRKLDGSQYAGTVDVVCGGYPCQPFSTAGKQLGEEDPRHLWPEMRRIIREARPRWVIAENVRGHVSCGLDEVLGDLESDGYRGWPFLIPSRCVGSEIQRYRLWIMGRRSDGEAGAIRSRSVGEQSAEEQESARGSQEQPALAGLRPADEWESESQGKPTLCGIPAGLPDQLERERAVGNAVDPRIAQRIGRAIIAYEQQQEIAA
jgi:DNA (cytosine-5)-methyltransferase 1